MDIENKFVLTWNNPTTRTDGGPISGTLSTTFELMAESGTLINIPDIGEPGIPGERLDLDFVEMGVAPGSYTISARTTEENNGVGKISARSEPLPFTLELVASPNPPTNLQLAVG